MLSAGATRMATRADSTRGPARTVGGRRAWFRSQFDSSYVTRTLAWASFLAAAMDALLYFASASRSTGGGQRKSEERGATRALPPPDQGDFSGWCPAPRHPETTGDFSATSRTAA